MRLSGRYQEFQVVEGAGDFEQFSQYHGAEMTAANDTNLERRHIVEQLLTVLHKVVTGTRLEVAASLRGGVLHKAVVIISLLAFFFSSTLVFMLIGLLTSLE